MRTLDWNATREKAEGMSPAQLYGAIDDIRSTLAIADRNDRVGVSECDGGYYRDEASVYHTELRRRGLPSADWRDRWLAGWTAWCRLELLSPEWDEVKQDGYRAADRQNESGGGERPRVSDGPEAFTYDGMEEGR